MAKRTTKVTESPEVITSTKLGKPRLGSTSQYLPDMSKLSNFGGSVMYGSEFMDSQNISRFPAEIRNPTLNPEMFFLPKFISIDGSPNIELNTWFDHYYRFHPIISNLINLHSTLPISRFGLVGIEDKKILQEYEDISEDLQIFEISMEILKAYFVRGEYALYGRWNDDIKSFSHLKLLDTNFITVTSHHLLFSDIGEDTEIIQLEPDELIQALVNSQNTLHQDLISRYLDPELRMAIENGMSVVLEPFSVSFVKRTVNQWDLRGTSILFSVLKTLILEDKLREFQYANAQANTTPIYHWKIGSDQYPADDDMIRDHQSIIQNLAYDPNKNIITNHIVNLDIKGAVGQTDKMFQDFEYIDNKILTALWGNKAFTHSEGITYNSSSVAMRVLMGRYIPIRVALENIFYKKIFLPIAMSREYYKRTEKDRPNGKSAMIKTSKQYNDLCIPTFDWRHKQSLMDDSNVRSMLIQLHQQGKMPMKVICDSLDLDYDYVMKWLEKESNTILDPYLSETKKILLNSAAAGGLKDTGEGMMKRILDASSAWIKSITGKPININIVEKKQEEEKEKEAKIYKDVQSKNIEHIIKKNAQKIESQLKDPKSFKAVYSDQDLMIRALKDNYYDNDFINIVKGQLYDMKVILAKSGTEYILEKTSIVNENNPVTIQSYLDKVYSFIEKSYKDRLYNLSKLAIESVNVIDSSIKKQANIQNIDFDKYKLDMKIAELDIVEKSVLKTYWDTIFPKLQLKCILDFIDVYRRKQIECYRKIGIKEFYVNGKKRDVDTFNFEIQDRLVPDHKYSLKKVFKLKPDLSIKIPLELIYNAKDISNKLILRGNHDMSNSTLDSFDSDYKTKHLSYLYQNMNNYDRLVELEEKHSKGETDHEEFFINRGLEYLGGKIKNEEIKEYFEQLYK